jgi:hypothetical protein
MKNKLKYVYLIDKFHAELFKIIYIHAIYFQRLIPKLHALEHNISLDFVIVSNAHCFHINYLDFSGLPIDTRSSSWNYVLH